MCAARGPRSSWPSPGKFTPVLGLVTALLGSYLGVADGVDDWENCPIFPTVNKIGIATQVVGFVGFILALTVVLVIYAYRKDQRALRERIILGLTLSSAVYSGICIAPQQFCTPPPSCSPRPGYGRTSPCPQHRRFAECSPGLVQYGT